MDLNQDSLYSNRGLCYISLKKLRQATSDLNKAISINPSNIKALKRLAHVKLSQGELLESEIYLKRCAELEPNDASHKEDVIKVRELITANDDLKRSKFTLDYVRSEDLAKKLVQYCTEATNIKSIYIESLLQNCKVHEALSFIKHKLTDEEKKMEEFEFLICQAYYYDGK